MFIVNTLANSIAEGLKINLCDDIDSQVFIQDILNHVSNNENLETYFVTLVIFDYLVKIILLDS